MQEETQGGRVCAGRRFCEALMMGICMTLGASQSLAEKPSPSSLSDEVAGLVQTLHVEGARAQRLRKRLANKMQEIEAGRDVNATNVLGQTALMYAAAINHFPAVCWLVAKGAKTDIKSNKDKTAADYTTDARVRALLRMAGESDNGRVTVGTRCTSMEQLALRVRVSVLAHEVDEPCVIINKETPEEVRQLALALHLPLQENTPVPVQSLNDVRSEAMLLAELFCGTNQPLGLAEDIPTLIENLHECGWIPDEYTWRLFLSQFLASNHPSHRSGESAEEYDLRILRALAQASGGKVPNDAIALLPESSPAFTVPHMTRIICQLLQLGASPNGRDEQRGNRTPLALAVTRDETLVRVLLAAGADVNAKLLPGCTTALHLAPSVDIARALLIAGANVRAADVSCPIIPYLVSHPCEGKGLASLCQFWATHGAISSPSAIDSIHADIPPDIYIALVRFFGGLAGVNVRLSGGRTPLHSAVNSPARVKALIQAGADVNVADGDGTTPLHIVSNPESALMLVHAGARLSATDHAGLMPLHRALGNPACVSTLIHAGADVNAADAQGRCPMELTTNINTLQLLIRAGADVNAKDAAGQTLLHRLVNSPNHVAALIQVGADVNAKDALGRTPLHLATAPDSIRLLAQAGARLNAPDACGLSPLHLAANSPERVEALIRAGAEVRAADPSGLSPLHITTSARTVELLVQAGADVNAVDNFGNTPLMAHAAVDNPPDVSAAAALLDAGADTTLLNHQGVSALRVAQERSDERHLFIELFSQRHITDIMLDPHARDAQGRTALMLLAMDSRPHIPTIQKLLADGADVNAQDRRGYSAIMHLMTSCDNPELLSLLLDAGGRTDIWSRDRKTPLSLAHEFHRDASAKLLTEYSTSKFNHIIASVLPKVQFSKDYQSFRNRSDYSRTYDTWRDPDALQSSGKFLVVISLSSQRGLFIVGDRPAMDFPVCTGRGSRHATPIGFFRISQKDRYHRSNLYHASMPFFMRLTNDGVGLHVGSVLRTPASHGCIRMQRDACQTLFSIVPIGTEVVIRE